MHMHSLLCLKLFPHAHADRKAHPPARTHTQAHEHTHTRTHTQVRPPPAEGVDPMASRRLHHPAVPDLRGVVTGGLHTTSDLHSSSPLGLPPRDYGGCFLCAALRGQDLPHPGEGQPLASSGQSYCRRGSPQFLGEDGVLHSRASWDPLLAMLS